MTRLTDDPNHKLKEGGEPTGKARNPSPPAEVPFGWRVVDAYFSLALLFAAEALLITLWFRRELAGSHEVLIVVRDLLPIALLVAAPAAVAGALLVELFRRANKNRAARMSLALLAAVFAGVVAFFISTGRFFNGGRRLLFVGAAFVLALLCVGLAAPPLARAQAGGGPSIRRSVLIGGAVALVLASLELCNAWILPRLYPAFHLGLGALALLTAPFATLAIPWAAPSRRTRDFRRLVRAVSALALFTLAGAIAPSSAQRLSHADNVRLIFLDHAPLLSHAVEIAALMAPPDPLAADDAPVPARDSARSIDWRGRDLILITIDALRADHVSAYGYARKTSPNLDRLAEQGFLFEHAYTSTPHTSYAVTSLLTGKHMRPLVLSGLGLDSETWAQQLRRYGYKTAAFYPPAVFFIDEFRLLPFRDRRLDFEYTKVQFASAAERAREVQAYLRSTLSPGSSASGDSEGAPDGDKLFLWIHLFEPHEPYEAHPDHTFGDRDVDRYDGEIAEADAGLGAIVGEIHRLRPNAVVIATADHGEEFLEHGGRYHGTTVYEEQVRVPLIIYVPGVQGGRRVEAPVQLADLLPTVLGALDVPRSARLRGRDLGPLLMGSAGSANEKGFAFSETDTQTMLARGSLRLLCARKVGACALYDVASDPGETRDVSMLHGSEFESMRAELRSLDASHGRYEIRGLRSDGKGWPDALRRGIAGDGEAASDVAVLLEDADVAIRRKAAEVLFELKRHESGAALRLALLRDEDDEVRRFAALALTRLGEGAPRTREMLEDPDLKWRRLSALALAEAGDDRGESILIGWFRSAYGKSRDGAAPLPFERALEITAALSKIRSKNAVPSLIEALSDVRLRPYLASALAEIGNDAARPALAEQLEMERYQTARIAIAEALVKLGAGPELVTPLVWLLGTPDPLPNGLKIAINAGLLQHVGGPRESVLAKLKRFVRSGVAIDLVVPKPVIPKGARLAGDAEKPRALEPAGLRVICRGRSIDGLPGEVRFGLKKPGSAVRESTNQKLPVPAGAPPLDGKTATVLQFPASPDAVEQFATLSPEVPVRPGQQGHFVVYATQNVELEACAVVPLSEELPPPPPEPWIDDQTQAPH